MKICRPCPACGGEEIRRIVWTEDAALLAVAEDVEIAFRNGPAIWNQQGGPDRLCTVCGERYCAELLDQQRYDEDSRRQKRRIEAMKRGDYMLFDVTTTSVDEIADAMWQKIQSTKDED